MDGFGLHKPAEHYTAVFEEWWSLYPDRKNDSKWAAFLQYRRAIKLTTPEVLKNALAQYANSDRVRKGVICHARTWLSQRRWESYEANEPTQDNVPDKINGRTMEQWAEIAKAWKARKFWPMCYGPEPGYGGCECPPELLKS